MTCLLVDLNFRTECDHYYGDGEDDRIYGYEKRELFIHSNRAEKGLDEVNGADRCEEHKEKGAVLQL